MQRVAHKIINRNDDNVRLTKLCMKQNLKSKPESTHFISYVNVFEINIFQQKRLS